MRNNGGGPADANISYLDSSGSYLCATLARGVAGHGTVSITVPAPPACGPNPIVSAVLEASQDVSLMVRHSGPGGVDADNGFVPVGYGDPAFERAGTALYAPSLYNNQWGVSNSTLRVLNTGSVTASVTFAFKGRWGSDGWSWASIPAYGHYTLDLSLVFGSSAWVGSLVITSDQPVVAQVSHTVTGATTRTYNASAGGGSVLYVPAVYKGWNGFTSGLVVQNIGVSNTTVTVYFYDRSGALRTTYAMGTLNVSRAAGVHLSGLSGLPAPWVGSARVVSSGQPLAVTVQTDYTYGGRNAFSGASAPGSTVYMPRAAKSAGGYTSSYLLQNSGSSSLQVTATYYDSGGNWAYARQHTLNAYGAAGNWLGADPLPAGWQGSIVFTADQPWLVVMLRDDLSNSISGYNGIGR
ncbi:MAG: hypothetical protein HY784_05160 [Chloroflexi bacterium]|nr:hypothetical protein [Chloroflexota bacterium]